MGIVPDLTTRVLQPELMDDPALDARGACARPGGSAADEPSQAAPRRLMWKPIRALAAMPGHGPVRVLDMATGSGDIPIRLRKRRGRRGLQSAIDACDISERAVGDRTERAKRAGVDVRFFRCDAMQDELPGGYDIVMCSLFTHHLEEPQVVVSCSTR